jgi:hypothetical protein
MFTSFASGRDLEEVLYPDVFYSSAGAVSP